jgi:hypothetical protein
MTSDSLCAPAQQKRKYTAAASTAEVAFAAHPLKKKVTRLASEVAPLKLSLGALCPSGEQDTSTVHVRCTGEQQHTSSSFATSPPTTSNALLGESTSAPHNSRASEAIAATQPSVAVPARRQSSLPTYQLSTTHRSFYPTGLHRRVPSAIVRHGDVTHTWRKLFGALVSVVCVHEEKFLIGVQVAALLNRETFNMYRSMKIKHIQTTRAKSDHIEFLARAGAVRGGTHSVTLIPYDACMYFIADARELAQRALIVGDIKGRRVRPTPLRSFLATKPRIHRRKPLPWNVRRSIKRQEPCEMDCVSERSYSVLCASSASSTAPSASSSPSSPSGDAATLMSTAASAATTAMLRSVTPEHLQLGDMLSSSLSDSSLRSHLASENAALLVRDWSSSSAALSSSSLSSSAATAPSSTAPKRNALLARVLPSSMDASSSSLQLSPPNTTFSQRELHLSQPLNEFHKFALSQQQQQQQPPQQQLSAMMVDTSDVHLLRTSSVSGRMLSSPTEPLPPTYESSFV